MYCIGDTLLCRMKEAVEEAAEHKFRFNQLTLGLMKRMKDELSVWQREILAWETDRTKVNPFEPRTKSEIILPV